MRAPAQGKTPAPPAIPDLITDQFNVVGSAAEGCHLIVGAGAHQYAAPSIAELRGIPYIDAVYAPVSLPSADLAPAGHPQTSEGAKANLLLWTEYKGRWNQRALERVNANRDGLSLPPVTDVLTHVLTSNPWLAADPILGPAPSPSTAGMVVSQTGAWILSDDNDLPAEVKAFLDAGDPPLYLGFGSMPAPETVGRTLIEAARSVGRRAILSQGWAELALIDEEPDCIVVGDLNHQALLPKVAAVVHHGGAGTTTAVALAGVPQIVVPMFADQFYWGERVRELGLGATLPMPEINTPNLVQSLRDGLRGNVVGRARSLAAEITTNGAAIAARNLLNKFGSSAIGPKEIE
jgi:vancomycin aglycone glucosyltransferase